MAEITKGEVAGFLRSVRSIDGYETESQLTEDDQWSAAVAYALDQKLVVARCEQPGEDRLLYITIAGNEFLRDWKWRWWRWPTVVVAGLVALDSLWSLTTRVVGLAVQLTN
jgi:hypothetical protein